MLRIVLAVAIILIASLVNAADSPSKYALFVGVSKYNHADMNKPQLEFPETDAKELADMFRKAGYAVDLLLGKQATQEAINSKLSQLKKKGDADGVAVIGLFGHGVEFESTKIACYCPYNTSMRNVLDSNQRQISDDDGKPLVEPDPESLITMPDLLAALRTSPAGNRILLADCCRTSPNKARGRAFGANVKLTDLPENTAAFFACSANEQAFEHPDWGHGAFTKCLIDEIKSQPANGQITAGTLADKLRPRVSRLVAAATGGKKQTTRSLVTDVVDFQLTSSSSSPPPSLLVAPFNREKAQSAQEAWAKSRGTNVITTNSIGAELVLIPPGEFLMGNEDGVEELRKLFPYAEKEWLEDAKKQHKVQITKPFQLGKYEVTIRQFRQFVHATGYVTEAETDDEGGWGYYAEHKGSVQDKRFHWRSTGFDPSPTDDDPVVNVSWNDAVAFCNWLSRKEGKSEFYRIQGTSVTVSGGNGYRLPTEAQWEYACRAGTITRYHNGNDPEGLARIGNVCDAKAKTKIPNHQYFLKSNDGFAFTSPVGRFSPNNFGLYDMTGNVCEWCSDWYSSEYDTTVVHDPVGASSGSLRVFRGSGWSGNAFGCRSASRNGASPGYMQDGLGFRLAAVPE
ncbi:MAG: SUMF1/EgtB/PvdO family nonheme iron enzyme [Schlesneria sp.]